MRLTQYINEASEVLKQWKRYIARSKMLSTAVGVLRKINSKGYKAFIVGGGVRDIILGEDPHDIDIATNMPIEELQKVYKVHDIGKSKDFGIVTIKQGGFNYEIAQFRNDGLYKDGRRPEKIRVAATFQDDSSRRDFTINAMGIDTDGNILDFFSGRKDIKNKILKTVGDPTERFKEDHLRIMRAARFSSKLDFEVDKDTKKAAQKLSSEIQNLSPERLRDELMKSAAQSGDRFAVYIKILDEFKILRFVLPELVQLKYMKHQLRHHPEGPTVWDHVIAALEVSQTKDPLKNLAILLHDIGKGITLSHEEGLPRYLGHAHAGISMVNAIADRLKFTNKERHALVFAIGNHMKMHNVLKMKPSKIAKLVNDENWDVLVAVAHADEYSRGETFKYAGEFEKMIDKCIKIKEKYGIRDVEKKLKLVSGHRVMELTGLKPGPKVGKIIKQTTEWIIDNDIEKQVDIDRYILSLSKKK